MKLKFSILVMLFVVVPLVEMNAQSYNVYVECVGNGGGSVYTSATGDRDLCGVQTRYNRNQQVQYSIQPRWDSDLEHLYVNSVDRMADVTRGGSGSSVSQYYFSFSPNTATSIQPVFMLTDMEDIPVVITCTGTGSGSVYKTEYPEEDLCGTTDYLIPGFVASYDFLPGQESMLTHLYVNNVDRVDELQVFSSNSSTYYRFFGYAFNSATSMVPIFERKTGFVPVTSKLDCRLSPNPASDGRTVLSVAGIQGSVEVSVYGIDGTVYARHQTNVVFSAGQRFELRGLPRGIYLVRVEAAEGSRTMKLIVQ
jgi:hypothetical protein